MSLQHPLKCSPYYNLSIRPFPLFPQHHPRRNKLPCRSRKACCSPLRRLRRTILQDRWRNGGRLTCHPLGRRGVRILWPAILRLRKRRDWTRLRRNRVIREILRILHLMMGTERPELWSLDWSLWGWRWRWYPCRRRLTNRMTRRKRRGIGKARILWF